MKLSNEMILCVDSHSGSRLIEEKVRNIFDNDFDFSNSFNKNVIIIVPEQFTLETEKRYIEVFGEKLMPFIKILSFKHLARLVFAETGALKYKFIGNGGKNSLMLKAVSEVSPFLKYYPENYRPLSFVKLVGKAVSELKISGISSEILQKTSIIENNDKLYDISLFASAYDALFSDGNFDADDSLSCLASVISSNKIFSGTPIFCDRFNVFLANEKEVLLALLRTDAILSVALPTPSLNEPKYSLFSVVSKNAASLFSKAEKQNTKINVTVSSQSFAEKSEDLKLLSNSIYKDGETCDHSDNITLYKATDIIDEVDFAAAKISKLVRESGYDFKDFIVITRESEPYSAVIEPIFSKYNIPLFCHRRVPLKIKPLCVLIDTLLSISSEGYRPEYVLRFFKTGLTEIPQDSVALFGNYVTKWKISYNKFLHPFTLSPEGFDREKDFSEQLENINSTRIYLTEKVNLFKDFVSNDFTVKNISKSLYNFLSNISIEKTLEQTSQMCHFYDEFALSSEQKQIYELIINTLDELVSAAGDDKVTLGEYKELLFSVIEESDIGIIPTALNEVMVGSVEAIPLNSPKIAFIMGLSDGIFPKTDGGFSLIDDRDRVLLEKYDLELGKTEDDRLLNEQFLVFKAVSAPTEKLFLSFSADSGGEARPSSAILEIQRIFPHLSYEKSPSAFTPDAICERIQNTASAFEMFSKYGSSTPTLENYLLTTPYAKFLKNQESTNLKKEVSVNLFGQNMNLSATKVSKFYECSFSYFCEYGIGLKKETKPSLNALEIGKYMHEILEKVIKIGLCRDNEDIKNDVERLSFEYLKSIFGNESPPAGFMTYFLRLIDKSVRLLLLFKEEFLQSEFVPIDFEVEINENGKIKPIKIPLDGEGFVNFVGKIDRIDILDKNGRKYIRIIDYKSGKKTFDLQYVYYGLDIQMLMYLFAVGKNYENVHQNFTPAACMYIKSNPRIVSIEKNEGYSEAEKKLEKSNPRSGIFLDNTEVLRAMDAELNGKYIPVKMTSKNNPLATEEEFGKLFNHIKNLLKNMGESLHSGKMEKNPIKSRKTDSCLYCVYSKFCSNSDCKGRKLDTINLQNIYERMAAAENEMD